MKEYMHQQRDPLFMQFTPGEHSAITKNEKVIPYEGRKLVAVQRYDSNGHYFVIVPGLIVNSRTSEHKRLVSEVEPVDESRQADITRLLQGMDFRGDVFFWSKDD